MDTTALLERFNRDKFGMFIHWGPYAALAGRWDGRQDPKWAEWIQLQAEISGSQYEAQAREFNPQSFDADAWVRTARDAGMKYVVFTSKHHDGFCMFHTRQTRYNIVDWTGFKRDPTRELAEACARHGVRLGFYYSVVDWHHPEFPPRYSNFDSNFHGFPNPHADIHKYADYQLAQIRELLTGYGPISVIWFDGGGSFQNADRYALLKGDEMVQTIRQLQPQCLINNRIGGGSEAPGNASTPRGDYGTPEQDIPGTIQNHAFEVCMTIGRTWGYNPIDDQLKSGAELTRALIDIAHKGGNFLLNVGPDGQGVIPEPSRQRLEVIGSWLTINGPSIYGTRNSLFASLPWGCSTTRLLPDGNTRIYLHVFDRPADGRLALPGLRGKILKAYPLVQPERRLVVEMQTQGAIVAWPGEPTGAAADTLVLDMAGPPEIRTVTVEVPGATGQAGTVRP
jgi:alpha-L-fucosidase